MPVHCQICFDKFIIDAENELLWKGSERIRLRPKTFALLLMLAERSGQLVTKRELLNAIWKDCHVKEEALNHCVAEIRQILNDNAKYPKFIETVSRRGYCFLAKSDAQNPEKASPRAIDEISANQPAVLNRQLVGRASELAQLHHCLKEASQGIRQVIFISGDQGVGKTKLVDSFIDIVNSERPKSDEEPLANPMIARGQCAKSPGTGESYMPFMEAIAGIDDRSSRKRIVAVLRRHAPLWLSQMPSLANHTKWSNFQPATIGADRERMMREMAEALEVMTSTTPTILVLEDLHWSDYSTLDLISYWAQRRGIARLLLVATYRPQDISSNDHPLKRIKEELHARQLCKDLPIPLLAETDIAEYLQHCFPAHRLPDETAAWIRERTGGNPLFMINVLNQMMTQGSLVFRSGYWVLDDGLKTVARFVPPTIQQIIEKQLESCTSDEQELLKAASVEGVEFSAAGIASAIGGRVEKIMDTFQSLARRNQFIQVTKYGGVRTVRYKFVHSLYQQTFYQLLSEKTRVQYHRRIAECIGKTKDNREEMASLLAMHLDRGGNSWKAVQYYLKAAEKANSRYAGHDASELAARGLRLLSDIPESPDRIELEVQLHNSLGDSMISARGLGSKEVKLAFSTSRFLFRKLSVRRQSTRRSLLFRALYGLWSYHWVHAEYAAALDLAMRMMQLAEIDHDPDMLDHAHYALGWLLMDHGDFVAALKHLRKSHNVYGHSLAALALWNLGYSDRALANLEKILVRDCETGNMKHGMFARLIIARVYMERRDIEKALEHSKTAFDLAIDHKFGEPWLAYIRSLYGWALAKIGQSEKGIEQIQYALDEIRAYGSSDLKPLFMGLYSDLLLNGERIDDGLAAVDEALDSASSTGINYMDAELHRLRGELLFQKIGLDNIQDPNNSQVSEILFYFETAIIVARKQGAKALELRATISLAKFLQKLNRQKEAYKRLKRISSWFTEGLEAADYCEALHLLKELK